MSGALSFLNRLRRLPCVATRAARPEPLWSAYAARFWQPLTSQSRSAQCQLRPESGPWRKRKRPQQLAEHLGVRELVRAELPALLQEESRLAPGSVPE
jgi:hypothetical protein